MLTSQTPPNFASSARSAIATPQVTQFGDLTSDVESHSGFSNELATANRNTSGLASGTDSGLRNSNRACGEMENTLIPRAPSSSYDG